jgi:hypothetical protein
MLRLQSLCWNGLCSGGTIVLGDTAVFLNTVTTWICINIISWKRKITLIFSQK